MWGFGFLVCVERARLTRLLHWWTHISGHMAGPMDVSRSDFYSLVSPTFPTFRIWVWFDLRSKSVPIVALVIPGRAITRPSNKSVPRIWSSRDSLPLRRKGSTVVFLKRSQLCVSSCRTSSNSCFYPVDPAEDSPHLNVGRFNELQSLSGSSPIYEWRTLLWPL